MMKDIQKEDNMAKKMEKVEEPKNTFDFADFNKKIDKYSDYGSLIDENDLASIDEWISTGNYILNAQISGSIYGGVPSGKITIFSGENSTGKTFVALSTAAEAQKMGYGIVWIDTEAALTKETTSNFGIDPKKFRYEAINTVEKLNTYISNLLSQLKEAKQSGQDPKIMVIIDSLGNLSTTKEVDDALSGSEKVDMTRAKKLKALFRIITSDLAYLQIPLIAINHVYATMSMYGGNEQSGGSGSKFAGSTLLEFFKSKLKDASGEQNGIIVTSRIKKSRFVKANIVAKIQIRFDKGMNPYVGLHDYFDWETVGIDSGKIEKGEFIYAKSGRGYAIEHLNKVIQKSNPSQLFCSEVFSKDQLDRFEKVIKPIFSFEHSVDDAIDFIDNLENDDEQ